jgi:hypothetical protein
MLSIFKKIYMGCDFPKKNVLKLFNDTNKNEEHLNKTFQLMKENLASTKKKNLDQKNDEFFNIKYKKDIEDVVKHACYCCKILCFAFQIRLFFKLYFNKLPNDLKNEIIEDFIFICNS